MSNKDSTLWILIALLVAVILLFSGGGMIGFGMGFGAMMGFGVIIMVLFWGAIIWLVISLINADNKKSEETPESALTILKKRYARGEITREQYLEMEKELTG
ncbi:MAG: SHOCT domain-containing protein [Candidatus Methanoperedens sp.]|nr:SHOCT domain-containing protein [Candidatus Methanoperedens sp.]